MRPTPAVECRVTAISPITLPPGSSPPSPGLAPFLTKPNSRTNNYVQVVTEVKKSALLFLKYNNVDREKNYLGHLNLKFISICEVVAVNTKPTAGNLLDCTSLRVHRTIWQRLHACWLLPSLTFKETGIVT